MAFLVAVVVVAFFDMILRVEFSAQVMWIQQRIPADDDGPDDTNDGADDIDEDIDILLIGVVNTAVDAINSAISNVASAASAYSASPSDSALQSAMNAMATVARNGMLSSPRRLDNDCLC